MLKLGSKKDHSIDYKCTIRLLDDNEVLECEFQVLSILLYYLILCGRCVLFMLLYVIVGFYCVIIYCLDDLDV